VRIYQALLERIPVEDAFIYGTRLYCWTFERKIRIYEIADVERALEVADPDCGPATNYALFHSRGLGASAAMVTAWHSAALRRQHGETFVSINGEDLPYKTLDVDARGVDVLDMLIFYNRLYLGTDAGLLAAEPFDPGDPPRRLRMQPRVKKTCYAVSGGLGSVAASCGEKGLYLLFDTNAWLGKGGSPRKAAAHSLRAEIGAASVVNHRARGEVEFLAGHTRDTARGRVLIDVRHAMVSDEGRPAASLTALNSGVEVALWDQSRLVTFHNGHMSSIGIARREDQRTLTRARELGTYDAGPTILGASRVGHTFALETEDSIIVAAEAETARISTGAIVSLRAYPRSKRYLRLVTSTSERGLWLIGIAEPSNSEPGS
jgi:hypothetical protein